MKLFIWYHAGNVTERYHSEAGIVVIAEDLASCRAMIEAATWVRYDPDSPCEALTVEPDVVREAAEGSPFIWIFPDAGCC